MRVLESRVLCYDESSPEETRLPWLLRKDPLNGGYKFLALVASTFTMLAFSSILCTSVLIVPLEDYFRLSRSDASLFVSLSLGMFCASTIFIGKIADRIGMYTVLVASIACLCFAFFVASFIDTYVGVMIVFCVFAGLGGAGSQMMPMLFIQDWWEPQRRVGFALGVTLGAVGLGNVVITLYMQHFVDTASWRAALRYTALLILLLGAIALAFARSRSLYPRRQRLLTVASVDLFSTALHGGRLAVAPPRRGLAACRPAHPQPPAAVSGAGTAGPVHALDCDHPGLERLAARADDVAAGPPAAADAHRQPADAYQAAAAPGTHAWAPDVHLSSLDRRRAAQAAEALGAELTKHEPFFIVSMFRRPRFVWFFVAVLIGAFNFYAPVVHLVPHAEDHGMSSSESAFLLVIVGILTIFSRIVFGVIVDIFGGAAVFAAANVLQLAFFIVWRYADTKMHFQAAAAFFGVVSGAYIVGTTATVRQLSLPAELSNAMDWVLGVGYAPGATLGGPVMGWIYASQGDTYPNVITGFAVAQAIPTLILLVLAFYRPTDNVPALPDADAPGLYVPGAGGDAYTADCDGDSARDVGSGGAGDAYPGAISLGRALSPSRSRAAGSGESGDVAIAALRLSAGATRSGSGGNGGSTVGAAEAAALGNDASMHGDHHLDSTGEVSPHVARSLSTRTRAQMAARPVVAAAGAASAAAAPVPVISVGGGAAAVGTEPVHADYLSGRDYVSRVLSLLKLLSGGRVAEGMYAADAS
jgi:nitrate/nitrite transporter NarK